MIPSGYKEDVVYSQIPTSGAGDLSFTRASNGTRINSAGLVEVVPWNLLLNTDTFSSWNLEGGTLTSGFTAPDGSTTAYKYVQIPGGGLYSGSGGVTEDVKFAQVWIKSVSGGSITVNLSDGAAFFGTFNVTGEWQLFTAPYTANSRIGLYLYGISNAQGIYVWHPQVNIGTTAKPYFPTTDRLNVPRLTYQNGGGGCPSLLLEKQSTNYSKWSNDLTQSSAWIDQSTNTTITQITSGGPDGGSFTRLVSTGSGSQGRIVQAGSITNPNGATMSVYLKGSGDTAFGLFIGNGISQYQQITLTNTWTRYVVSVSGVGATYQDWQISCVGGSTIDVSFVQVEEGVYATSPIPTTSSSATRVADACFKTGISSLIGQTEGTMYIDFYYDLANNTPNGSDKSVMTIRPTGGGTNNEIAIVYYGDEGGSYGKTIQVFVSVGGTTQCLIKTPQNLTNGYYKVAFAYKQNDFALYVNGVQIGTDSSGSVPTCSELYFTDPLRVTSPTAPKEAVLFPTRLTNAELASLTTI